MSSVYIQRSLDKCKRQLAETEFTDPLDSAQIRQLTNIEQLLNAEYPDVYRSRVDQIRQQIQPWVAKKQTLLASISNGRQEEPQKPQELEKHKKSTSLSGKRAELLGEIEGLRRRGAVPDTVEGVEKLLQSQRATQDDLSSDLARMATVLKKNSLAFGDVIEQDKAVIEEAGHMLDANTSNVGSQGKRLNVYRSRAWGTTGLTWLAVLVVVCVFFLLVLFMRVAPKRH